ncbi:hypothetical protein, partial [Klebsiella pneumoniae]|uniref:hypothetical protein n=1 Tax=Klebsiella pneumoniae TaxID=573 RepID=UPI003013F46B
PLLASGKPVAPLAGSPTKFDFVGELPTGFGDSRRAEMSLTIDRGRLVLLWRPYLHRRTGTAPAPPGEIELVNGVGRLELA